MIIQLKCGSSPNDLITIVIKIRIIWYIKGKS